MSNFVVDMASASCSTSIPLLQTSIGLVAINRAGGKNSF
jgi:hypothetical protein